MDIQFEQLVDRMYLAATDRSLWPAWLETLAGYFGSRSAQVMIYRVGERWFELNVVYGLGEFDLDLYNRYILKDPIWPTLYRDPCYWGRAFRRSDMIPMERLRNSEMFKHVLAPYDAIYALGCTMIRDDGLALHLGLLNGERQSDFSDSDMDNFSALLPHFRRVMEIDLRFKELRQDLDATMGALEGIATPIVVLDSLGGVRTINPAAREAIARTPEVVLSANQLSLRRRDLNRQLVAALRRTAPAADGAGHLVVEREHDMSTVVIEICPIRGGASAGSFFDSREHLSALVLRESAMPLETSDELLWRVYALTPKEGAVAKHIAQGRSLREASAEEGISYNTGRVHLRSVQQKMGVRRQTEVCAILNRLARSWRDT